MRLRSREPLARQGCRRDNYSIGGKLALEPLYQWSRRHKLSDRDGVYPDGLPAVATYRFGQPAQSFNKTAGIFAVTRGLINEVRQQSEKQQRERSEEHTSELQSHSDLVCRLLLEKKKIRDTSSTHERIL